MAISHPRMSSKPSAMSAVPTAKPGARPVSRPMATAASTVADNTMIRIAHAGNSDAVLMPLIGVENQRL